VALQVKGGTKASNQGEFAKFLTYAKAISDALGERIFSTIPAPNNVSGEAEVNALRDAIAAQISRNVNAVAKTRDAVLGALGGDTRGVQSNLPESLIARAYLDQLGFSMERLVEIGKRTQIVQKGFVFQNGPDGDFRYWLGLRRPEFNNLRTSVVELCENILNTDLAAYIEDSVLKLATALTLSDPQPGESLRDYFARVSVVPAYQIPTVLKETPDQFVRHLNQPGERAAVVINVCRSAKLLNMVGEGQIVDNPERDIVVSRDGHASLRPGLTPRQFDWRWFSPDVRSEWFFVPMD